jgi:hypothetical protein
VGNPRTGASILHFSPLDYFIIPHAILMSEFPVHAIRNDLDLLVGMCYKSGMRLQGKIIKCYQVPEADIRRVIVISKGEVETADMPAIVSEVYLPCKDFGQHIISFCISEVIRSKV